MTKLENIFFDFDGVLAESVHVKTEAFYKMYLPYGQEIADKVKQHHRENGGMSRFEKFAYYSRSFLQEEIDQNKILNLAENFSKLVMEGVINSEEIKGATYFLEKYHNRLKFWIITGTPTDEIEHIILKRKMSKYFVGVHGSPQKKDFWTEKLITDFSIDRNKIIFLGDAMSDFNAATFSKLHFALRDYEENRELFKTYQGTRFIDFYDLENQLVNRGLL